MNTPSILNPQFKYVPHDKTDIRETFKKHGFKPTTKTEREKRQAALIKEPGK